MPVINRVAAMQDEVAAWRQDLHEHPELGFDVHRTAGIVADKLKAFGCDEVVPGIGKTGVVGIIKGRKTTSGRVMGLRADMDALPIQEATGVPYASKTPGKMHACGHDGHTSMLLGRGQVSVRDAQLRRHGVRDLPAQRGRPDRRRGDAGGRADRPLRHPGALRHAHLARRRARHVRHPAGAAAGGRRPVHDRDRGQGRACHGAAHERRSGGRGGAHHHGAADDCIALDQSAGGRGGVHLHGARGRCVQHHSRDGNARRARCARSSERVRDIVETRLRRSREGTAAAFGATAIGPLRALRAGHHERCGQDRACRARRARGRRRQPTCATTYPRRWVRRISPTCSRSGRAPTS